jgi:DUF4097 and DUF4098 domain-containing protein YvlB
MISAGREGDVGMGSIRGVAKLMIVGMALTSTLAAAQNRKQYRFNVSPRATIAVTNQYGPISVKPGTANQVVVSAFLHSDKVEVDQSQTGNRIDLTSHLLSGATADSARVDYELLVPTDASVVLRSNDGVLRAEGLRGDVILEGANPTVDVRDISDAHVHARTLSGPVMLTNIRGGHVEITSVSGDVTLQAVTGPQVQVNSTSGRIRYDGDFGSYGEYYLASHSGDIEASAPSDASIDVTARSVRGKVENDFPLEPKRTPFVVKAGSAFAGTMNKAASSVKLFSFSGKIHLKKR